jgi:hypothetical protein
MVIFILGALGGKYGGVVTFCKRYIPTDYTAFLCNYNICNLKSTLHVYGTSFLPPWPPRINLMVRNLFEILNRY